MGKSRLNSNISPILNNTLHFLVSVLIHYLCMYFIYGVVTTYMYPFNFMKLFNSLYLAFKIGIILHGSKMKKIKQNEVFSSPLSHPPNF